jgi:DNA-binding NtrC family response regulator
MVLTEALPPPRHRVLIVDQSRDSRDVLRTALERRGIQIIEAAEARHGAALAREYHPEVIVLDLESESADDEQVRDQFDAASRDHHANLVVLGQSRRYEQALPKERIMSKPYHYAPLVHTIEQLLEIAPGS